MKWFETEFSETKFGVANLRIIRINTRTRSGVRSRKSHEKQARFSLTVKIWPFQEQGSLLYRHCSESYEIPKVSKWEKTKYCLSGQRVYFVLIFFCFFLYQDKKKAEGSYEIVIELIKGRKTGDDIRYGFRLKK